MGTAVNYITNPSFESNSSGWIYTNGSGTRDTTMTAPGSGTYCMKVTPTAGSVPLRFIHTGVSNLTVGTRYNISMYVYVPSSSSTDYYIGISAGIVGKSAVTSIRNAWTRLSVSFVATISNPNFVLYSVSDTVSINDVVYVDRASLTQGANLLPYFDGDSPLSTWSGTTGASQSSITVANDFPSTTTQEMLILGNLCMNTPAWNITTRGGRMNLPQKRGNNTVVPTRGGAIFVPYRPYDVNTFVLSMWATGVNMDGTIPAFGDQRRMWEYNMNLVLGVAASQYEPVTAYSWQADGTVRYATLDLNGTTNVTTMAGATRGEFTLSFDVLDGYWSDWLATTVQGTAGTGWSNQTLAMPQLSGSTAPIDDAVVTVLGAAQNPRVTSASNVWTQLNRTLSSSESFVLDSGNYTAMVGASSVQTLLSRSGNHPRFMSIPVKNGVVPSLAMTATGTSSSTNLRVTARRHHWAA